MTLAFDAVDNRVSGCSRGERTPPGGVEVAALSATAERVCDLVEKPGMSSGRWFSTVMRALFLNGIGQ